MKLAPPTHKKKQIALFVIVFGVVCFALGWGLFFNDLASMYDLVGKSSSACRTDCISITAAEVQLHVSAVLRNVDLAIVAIGGVIAVVGVILLSKAKKLR